MGRAIKGSVAGHGGDGEKGGMLGGKQECDHVVVARVAVQDHR